MAESDRSDEQPPVTPLSEQIRRQLSLLPRMDFDVVGILEHFLDARSMEEKIAMMMYSASDRLLESVKELSVMLGPKPMEVWYPQIEYEIVNGVGEVLQAHRAAPSPMGQSNGRGEIALDLEAKASALCHDPRSPTYVRITELRVQLDQAIKNHDIGSTELLCKALNAELGCHLGEYQDTLRTARSEVKRLKDERDRWINSFSVGLYPLRSLDYDILAAKGLEARCPTILETFHDIRCRTLDISLRLYRHDLTTLQALDNYTLRIQKVRSNINRIIFYLRKLQKGESIERTNS